MTKKFMLKQVAVLFMIRFLKRITRNAIKSKKFIGGHTMILIIDNYDSFTYNLVDIVSKHQNVIVKYPDDPDALTYQETVSGVIISPGQAIL